jgi:hypothetical protein
MIASLSGCRVLARRRLATREMNREGGAALF